MPPLFGDGKPAAHAAAALPSGIGTFTVASAAVAVDANVTSTAASAVSRPTVRRERVEICMRVPSSYGDQEQSRSGCACTATVRGRGATPDRQRLPRFGGELPSFLTSGGEPVRGEAGLAERGGHHVGCLPGGRERLDDLGHGVVRVLAVFVRELTVFVLDNEKPGQLLAQLRQVLPDELE